MFSDITVLHLIAFMERLTCLQPDLSGTRPTALDISLVKVFTIVADKTWNGYFALSCL